MRIYRLHAGALYSASGLVFRWLRGLDLEVLAAVWAGGVFARQGVELPDDDGFVAVRTA